LFAWHRRTSSLWPGFRNARIVKRFFMLLTLLGYARYAQGRRGSRVEGRVRKRQSGSRRSTLDFRLLPGAVVLRAGTDEQPMLVTLPAILLLLDSGRHGCRIQTVPRRRTGSRNFHIQGFAWEKIPFLALSLVSVMATFQAQGSSGFIIKAGDLPLPVRIANVPVFCTVYLGKAVLAGKSACSIPTGTFHFWEQAGSFVAGPADVSASADPFPTRLAVGWLCFSSCSCRSIGLCRWATVHRRPLYIFAVHRHLCHRAWVLGKSRQFQAAG